MNIFWLDASAVVKHYVRETGTSLINHLFTRVSPFRMICLLEGIGEVISIFVRHRNARIITSAAFNQAMIDFHSEVTHCIDMEKMHPTSSQVITSWGLIEKHFLNSTDAIILRCAVDKAIELRADEHNLVLVSSDARLIKAAQAEGVDHVQP